jgi:hypothetical protein
MVDWNIRLTSRAPKGLCLTNSLKVTCDLSEYDIQVACDVSALSVATAGLQAGSRNLLCPLPIFITVSWTLIVTCHVMMFVLKEGKSAASIALIG